MTGGKWLRSQMDDLGIDVHRVVEALGLRDKSTVYNWLRDKSKPSDENAADLAELLDVPELEVRYRFGLYIPKALLEEAQAERELLALRELAENSGP